MPTPSDKVRLLIGGKFHEDWESYDIDSDLLIPADAWHVTLGLRQGELPGEVCDGAPVEVLVGDERVMVGRIDDIAHRVSKRDNRYAISGRDTFKSRNGFGVTNGRAHHHAGDAAQFHQSVSGILNRVQSTGIQVFLNFLFCQLFGLLLRDHH